MSLRANKTNNQVGKWRVSSVTIQLFRHLFLCQKAFHIVWEGKGKSLLHVIQI